jgi:cobalt-zinc-cadmium efflux system protein
MSSHHDHNHDHSHHHSSDDDEGVSGLKVAFFLNVFFSIVEFIGGFFTNSLAIISDAIHDLGDSLAIALAWFFQKLSKKKRNSKFSYGYKRFAILGAIINSMILLFGSLLVIYGSVMRLLEPQQPDALGMFWLAIAGIAINGFAMLNILRGKKKKNLNTRAVALHLMEDVLGWVAVLIGSIVMIFVDVPILDPLLSLGISVYILYNAIRNLKDSFYVIMQGVPDGIK